MYADIERSRLYEKEIEINREIERESEIEGEIERSRETEIHTGVFQTMRDLGKNITCFRNNVLFYLLIDTFYVVS